MRRGGRVSRPGRAFPRYLVACPDARPPAYEAVAGLARAGELDRFLTGFYYRGHGPIGELVRQYAPCQFHRLRRRLLRRNDRRIPADLVTSIVGFDLALAVEARLGRWSAASRAAALWRTRRFDRAVAREVRRGEPSAVLAFSDVGSEATLDECRRRGIPFVLSMVHGEVGEELDVLAREQNESPDYYPLYLGDGRLDRNLLDWLHARRLREVAWADRVLVPSEHIASRLVGQGIARDRIAVVPYAADLRRFQPRPEKAASAGCTFLFAGGITQRKGIKYLMRAWAQIRRPDWKLQLLGPLPRHLGPLENDLKLEGVEHLGQVAHAEVPDRMASADVFVFPSLFEGSAVVTYEALACGLPSVATAASGTVARDGIEGIIVPPRNIEALARAMERLGLDPVLRSRMAIAARQRAEEFSWPRYHLAIRNELAQCLAV
jgi:starch synthase